MNLSRDQLLGHYRLIRSLGQGGFANTYLGEQIYLRTPAAVKVIQAALAHEYYESFFTEARLIAGLKHPNIVRLLDFGIESSRNIPYLVMEYAPNGTLRQRYPRGEAVAVSALVPYVKQVAAALDYAHEQKIIHRDVKPENMLVGVGNEILLADFGIAVVESTRTHTQGMIAGTVSYMAPEQIRGKAVPASDQYALAVVVYEWLCGTPPFTGSYTEVAIQHQCNVPKPLREHLARIPVDVEQVVSIALAKDPHQRFESVQAFATALEQASSAVPRVLPVPAASPGDRHLDMSTPSASDAHLPQGPSAYQASPLASRGEAAHSAYGQGVSSNPAPAPSGEQGVSTPPPLPDREHSSAPLPPISASSPLGLTPQVTPMLTPDFPHVSAGQPPFQPASIPSMPAGPYGAASPPPSSPGRKTPIIIVATALLLLVLVGGSVFTLLLRKPTSSGLTPAQVNASATATIIAGNRNPYPNPGGGTLTIYDPLRTYNPAYGWDWKEVPVDGLMCTFSGGSYHVTEAQARGDPNDFYTCNPEGSDNKGYKFNNFAFEVQMRILKGDAGGIIFRLPTSSGPFYYFRIGVDGTYQLQAWTNNASNPKVLSKGNLQNFNPDNNNVIAAVASGKNIDLYVNFQSVGSEVVDSTASIGNIGLAATASSRPADVAFNNAKLWQFS